jgi:hypothetical protein
MFYFTTCLRLLAKMASASLRERSYIPARNKTTPGHITSPTPTGSAIGLFPLARQQCYGFLFTQAVAAIAKEYNSV